MPLERQTILLAAFTALESGHFYSAFLPSVMTIRKFAIDQDALNALRQGEVIATLFTVTLDYLVSQLAKSDLPLYFSIGAAVAFTTVYEQAIRTSPQFAGL